MGKMKDCVVRLTGAPRAPPVTLASVQEVFMEEQLFI